MIKDSQGLEELDKTDNVNRDKKKNEAYAKQSQITSFFGKKNDQDCGYQQWNVKMLCNLVSRFDSLELGSQSLDNSNVRMCNGSSVR